MDSLTLDCLFKVSVVSSVLCQSGSQAWRCLGQMPAPGIEDTKSPGQAKRASSHQCRPDILTSASRNLLQLLPPPSRHLRRAETGQDSCLLSQGILAPDEGGMCVCVCVCIGFDLAEYMRVKRKMDTGLPKFSLSAEWKGTRDLSILLSPSPNSTVYCFKSGLLLTDGTTNKSTFALLTYKNVFSFKLYKIPNQNY